jgi:flagellar M-ring protein FliF
MRARTSRRTTAIGVGAVLILWPIAAVSASASTGTVPGNERAAAVQTVLDRVLGPGNATVVVADTIRTSRGTSTSTRWGNGVPASTTSSKIVTAGGTSVASSQQNRVGSTTTVLVNPAGTLLRETVSVVVDRAHLGSTSLASLRRLVRSTAAVVPSRGDRVSIVVTPFARTAAVVAPAVTPLALLLPSAVPAMWVVGALLALLILARAVRGPRRTRTPSAGA